MQPKVSVIVPVYGVEKYIERCAVSLFEQTLDDIEYIFVNDCTKDKSIEILKGVLCRYPNREKQVRIVDMASNSGQAAVRKYGISLATGEFIIHCDSDDWVEVDMYKSMYNRAVETSSDIVVCDYNISNNQSNFEYIHNLVPLNKNEFINGVLDGSVHASLCNKLVKASLYEYILYFPKDNYTEDMVITTQLVYYARRINSICKGFYHYCINPESITQKRVDAYLSLKLGKQCYNNFIVIYKFLSQQPNSADFESNITLRKYRIKLFLRNICRIKGGVRRWREIFPELSTLSVLKYHLPLSTKVGYIVTYMGLYGCLRPLNKDKVDAIMLEIER